MRVAITRVLAVLAVAAFLTLFLLISGPAGACACGAAYVPDGHTVRSGEELAFLSWASRGTERLEMGLSLSADSRDLAVLVPTPHVPKVAQGHNETFDRLATLTAPVEEDSGGSNDGNGAGAPAPQQQPSVVSRTVLDDVVATVIKGGTARGVTRWLAAHGYAQKPRLRPVIAAYLRDGWAFTAVKLRADRPFEGPVDPLVLSFDSARLVYPMRLSSASGGVEKVTVYTLDHSFDGRADKGAAANQSPAAAVSVAPDNFTSDSPLHRLAQHGRTRMTKYVYTGLEPAALTSDFTFTADPGLHEFRPVTHEPDTGLGDSGDSPRGPVLAVIVAAAAAVVVGAGVLVGRRSHE